MSEQLPNYDAWKLREPPHYDEDDEEDPEELRATEAERRWELETGR